MEPLYELQRPSFSVSSWGASVATDFQTDAYRIEARKKLRGEIGILKHVIKHDAMLNKGFLVMEHEGERWMGCLIIDDHAFCEQISDLLRTQLGRSIKEIGDLDLIFTM